MTNMVTNANGSVYVTVDTGTTWGINVSALGWFFIAITVFVIATLLWKRKSN
jgi:hypothetical protein